MKKTLADITPRTGSIYPSPYKEMMGGRSRYALGNACGLDQFGVNILVLAPGARSSLRHWHTREDEFVYVLEGEVTLVTDAGETMLTAGEFAGFKAGVPDGHSLINRSDREARVLEVGARNIAVDEAYYPDPDVDLMVKPASEGTRGLFRKNGEAY